jgi:hypothetical protein
LSDISNIYATCKETQLNGYFCYTFTIGEITHYVFGETKEEAFDFVADYIETYLKWQK